MCGFWEQEALLWVCLDEKEACARGAESKKNCPRQVCVTFKGSTDGIWDQFLFFFNCVGIFHVSFLSNTAASTLHNVHFSPVRKINLRRKFFSPPARSTQPLAHTEDLKRRLHRSHLNGCVYTVAFCLLVTIQS